MDVKVIVPHILHGVNSIVVRSEALAKPDALESAGRGPEIVHVRSPFIIHRMRIELGTPFDFASGWKLTPSEPMMGRPVRPNSFV
jgi:hypothetical protein